MIVAKACCERLGRGAVPPTPGERTSVSGNDSREGVAADPRLCTIGKKAERRQGEALAQILTVFLNGIGAGAPTVDFEVQASGGGARGRRPAGSSYAATDKPPPQRQLGPTLARLEPAYTSSADMASRLAAAFPLKNRSASRGPGRVQSDVELVNSLYPP